MPVGRFSRLAGLSFSGRVMVMFFTGRKTGTTGDGVACTVGAVVISGDGISPLTGGVISSGSTRIHPAVQMVIMMRTARNGADPQGLLGFSLQGLTGIRTIRFAGS